MNRFKNSTLQTQRPGQAKNAVRLRAILTFTCNCSAVHLMTPCMSKVYEETYKDRLIEIYRFSQSAPSGVGSSHFFARIDNCQLPGAFDARSHNPNHPSSDTGNQSTPEPSSALAAASAYCDSEAEAQQQIATHDLQQRIEVLLQEPSAAELTHKTNLVSRALMKIRRFVGIIEK